MTPEDIKDWQGLEATKAFFEEIKRLRDDTDMRVHQALTSNEMYKAGMLSADMETLDTVLELPQRMIEEAEEEK